MTLDSLWRPFPDTLHLPARDVHVWRVPLDLSPQRREGLAMALSEDERERAEHFYFERHRHRFIVARGALRAVLARYLGLAPGKIRFNYGSRGKPFLAAPTGTRLRFNLAHSHDLALLAVAQGRELGIDVEHRRPISDAADIAARFFSPRECAQFHEVAAADVPHAFLNCWTRKEAYIKATGDGLSRPLDSFDVSFLPGEPPRLTVLNDPVETERWRMHALSPGPDYVAALVVEGPTALLSYWMF